jgi:ABC-type uncharacterized transport system permease subunit
MEPLYCTGLAFEVASKGYAFFSGSDGQLLLGVAAAMKGFILYCGRSRYQEARELAFTLTAGLLFVAVIAAIEFNVPASIKQAMSCEGQPRAVAGLRNGLHPGESL